jgi:3-deoxy-D-manno-octulosonate 8-phosphate phosphatase (KDO 8-P phosphatase)
LKAAAGLDVDRETLERARRIRLVLLDVDGVLTDGRLYMDSGGGDARSFHVRDGHGIRLGQRAGLRFGIVSGRESRVVARRAEELSISEVHQKIGDKLACVERVLGRLGLAHDAVCFVGDDMVDIPVMRRVGLAVAPRDAAREALEAAHFVTSAGGGRGAVREVVELLLKAGDRWDAVTRPFLE